MCVTDRHDMIFAAKVVLNPNTTKYNEQQSTAYVQQNRIAQLEERSTCKLEAADSIPGLVNLTITNCLFGETLKRGLVLRCYYTPDTLKYQAELSVFRPVSSRYPRNNLQSSGGVAQMVSW